MRVHRFFDEFEAGFGWIIEETTCRTSHALAADGGVWLVDPVEVPDLEKRIAPLGEVRGVIQLIDRHNRDCARLAQRLGVSHHRVPFGRIPQAPFDFVRIARIPLWREVALWWPEKRTLVAGDALGTLPYFCEPGASLGVHPLLRLFPPRRLAGLEPVRVLCGHGEGVHEGAAEALREALSRARRGLPATWAHGWRWARGRD